MFPAEVQEGSAPTSYLSIVQQWLENGDGTGQGRAEQRDFTGGPVVKDLLCNAGDVSVIPGQGTKIPHASE